MSAEVQRLRTKAARLSLRSDLYERALREISVVIEYHLSADSRIEEIAAIVREALS